MKPYGIKRCRRSEGCLCSLCRSRGYRKGSGFEADRPVVCKSRARQEGKKQSEAE